jgi:hypothetical protein
MVLNSDSDDSLPELDWGPLTSNVKTLDPVIRSKNLTTNVDDDDGLRRPERRSKSKKRPFDHVVETAQNNKKLERIITEHKADLYKDVEQSPAGGFVFTEDALDQAVQDDDDPDKAHRLFLAMQRTNATQVETVFHFFSKPSALPAAKTKFPIDSLPACRWTSSLRGKNITSSGVFRLLTFIRCLYKRPSFPERFRTPGLPNARASTRACFMDDRSK